MKPLGAGGKVGSGRRQDAQVFLVMYLDRKSSGCLDPSSVSRSLEWKAKGLQSQAFAAVMEVC
ncbi:MAG: hypothetical protein J5600_02710, partial [Desulfovibrio sp.]|nr:hypothetical protein [Desulfovibrio sp.]